MKRRVIELISEALKKKKINVDVAQIEKAIEVPPTPDLGDFAFPCFFLAKELKLAPPKIALDLKLAIGNAPEFKDIQTAGPYLNFFLDRKEVAKQLIIEISNKKDDFGKSILGSKNKTLIEFPSPNTNKPLHLGHLRNMSIGESIARVLEFANEKVVRINLNNDRGVHICKSMLAYQKWGKGKEPSSKLKSDHLVGDFYVMFAQKAKENPELEKEAQDMLLK